MPRFFLANKTASLPARWPCPTSLLFTTGLALVRVVEPINSELTSASFSYRAVLRAISYVVKWGYGMQMRGSLHISFMYWCYYPKSYMGQFVVLICHWVRSSLPNDQVDHSFKCHHKIVCVRRHDPSQFFPYRSFADIFDRLGLFR